MVALRVGAAKSGCLFLLLVAAVFLYVGVPVGEAFVRYAEYKDAMRQELRFRGNQSNDKIRLHLQIQADSLGLPDDAGDVRVTRSGNQVTVESEYDEVIEVLGIARAIHFSPRASDTY